MAAISFYTDAICIKNKAYSRKMVGKNTKNIRSKNKKKSYL